MMRISGAHALNSEAFREELFSTINRIIREVWYGNLRYISLLIKQTIYIRYSH
jgi:hypothetical protein